MRAIMKLHHIVKLIGEDIFHFQKGSKSDEVVKRVPSALRFHRSSRFFSVLPSTTTMEQPMPEGGKTMKKNIAWSEKSEWFEKNILDENSDVKERYKDALARLEWVESFKIADANEENDKRHLEIVCMLGKVPRISDIVKIFGEDILLFITYQKGSKREWFESNILGKHQPGRKKKFTTDLSSLSWVKDFYVGVASEREKSWQLFITCAQNKLPSMEDLKDKFGDDIASFVDFIQDDYPNEKSLPPSYLLRGPRSGDGVIVSDSNSFGTIGIIGAAKDAHYTTTCYHVCFDGNQRPASFTYMEREQEQGQQEHGQQRQQLGQYVGGLFDRDHDLALIKMEPTLNGVDAVNFLSHQDIRTELADIDEVDRILFERKVVPVEKFGFVTGKTRGLLFARDGGDQFPPTGEAPSYRIRNYIHGKQEAFAEEGDSGSLVYLLYDGKKIPFGYLYAGAEYGVYACRNLDHSMKELIRCSNLEDIRLCH